MDIKKIGVIGCGQMGGGIAQVSAQSGYKVVVSEVNQELLNKGLNSIKSFLDSGVKKGRLTEQARDSTLSNIKGTTNLEDYKDCDLVIEAIIEKIEEKKKAFARLDQICPPATIFASNTSCLSIIEMAMVTRRADKVLGMHFFNPVPLMKLLELVKSIATSNETIETARKVGQSLGKQVILAKDTPGFIVNGLLVPYMLDAIRFLESGVATKEDIDTGITLGLNHPMGPFTLGDFVGLDTLYFIANAMYEEFKNAKYAAPPLLKKMVTAGLLGRKTGKGFYEYK